MSYGISGTPTMPLTRSLMPWFASCILGDRTLTKSVSAPFAHSASRNAEDDGGKFCTANVSPPLGIAAPVPAAPAVKNPVTSCAPAMIALPRQEVVTTAAQAFVTPFLNFAL